MAETALLKDQLGPAAVVQLAERLKAAWPDFDQQAFIKQACQDLETLELKARVQHIVAVLSAFLPAGFCETARILERVTHDWPLAPDRNWSNYAAWPLIDYVSVYGLDYPQRSFALLEKMTPLFTAEFAIRPFLDKHFDLTHQQLRRWTQHDDEHVRRLATEGIRPRLPWARQIKALRVNPVAIWPILEQLKADPSLYVRRSVANNLNDISKDHPQAVLAICRQWQRGSDEKTNWVMRHGLRTLVKTGHPEVYALLGFSDELALKRADLSLSAPSIKVGEKLNLTLAIETENQARLVLDYRIVFVRADGKPGWKVFKWKNIETQGKQTLTLHKSHAFMPLTTRRYYPGRHQIECLLNGQVVAKAAFFLELA
jgi:3-methyladenine DNA glycosylase AlkC